MSNHAYLVTHRTANTAHLTVGPAHGMKGEKYRDGLEVAAVLSKVAVTVSTPDPRYIEFAQTAAECLRALGVKAAYRAIRGG